MSANYKLVAKIVLFSLIVMALQVVVASGFTLPINLILASILVFASLFGILENLILAFSFLAIITMLSYDSQVAWIYLIVAIVATRMNPMNIADKLLVCMAYVLIFTPIVELFNPSSQLYLSRLITAYSINFLICIPLYFLVKTSLQGGTR